VALFRIGATLTCIFYKKKWHYLELMPLF